MDLTANKDLLRVLAVVLVPILYGFLSGLFKKKEAVHAVNPPTQPKRKKYPLPHSQAEVVETAEPGTSPQTVYEEGQRVTDDISEVTEPTSTNYNIELTKEDLRRAVIWSDILTPKFRQ